MSAAAGALTLYTTSIAKRMEELVAMFRQRGDRYVDQCDALYAFLVEPFLILKDPCGGECHECPPPSFLVKSDLAKCDEDIPKDLLEL